MLAILKKSKKRNAEKADAEERAAIAQLFNDRYTFRKEYVKGKELLKGSYYGFSAPSSGYAWMCPDCNRIHHPTESSVFSGLQYPACCKTGEGHRLSHGINMGG
jgi:hypothetical protein